MSKNDREQYFVNSSPELVSDDLYAMMTHVIRLANLFEHMATKEINSELSFTQIKILSMIQTGVCKKSSEFALHFNVSKANMTGMIGRLEKKGYVFREECEKDYRVKILKLTGKGEKYISNSRPKFYKLVNKALDEVNLEQVKQTNACLTQSIQGIEEMIRP